MSDREALLLRSISNENIEEQITNAWSKLMYYFKLVDDVLLLTHTHPKLRRFRSYNNSDLNFEDQSALLVFAGIICPNYLEGKCILLCPSQCRGNKATLYNLNEIEHNLINTQDFDLGGELVHPVRVLLYPSHQWIENYYTVPINSLINDLSQIQKNRIVEMILSSQPLFEELLHLEDGDAHLLRNINNNEIPRVEMAWYIQLIHPESSDSYKFCFSCEYYTRTVDFLIKILNFFAFILNICGIALSFGYPFDIETLLLILISIIALLLEFFNMCFSFIPNNKLISMAMVIVYGMMLLYSSVTKSNSDVIFNYFKSSSAIIGTFHFLLLFCCK